MKLANVRLIFQREVRDQLRDRRMLFMIFVLPMLLYPLLGMSFFQIVQFMREHASRVKIVGLPDIDGLPPLVEKGEISARWLGERFGGKPIEAHLQPAAVDAAEESGEEFVSKAREEIRSGAYQAVVYFPPAFKTQMEALRRKVVAHEADGAQDAVAKIPQPAIYFNGADDNSRFTHSRLEAALRDWTAAIGESLLHQANLPTIAARPFETQVLDIAEREQRQAVLWSKILPFVLFIWALTGAFYPAIDLCAGEKERGTLETLLSSPAKRSEIVTGKMLTVMLFSIATSTLNLLSMGLTGAFVLEQMRSVGAGPDLGPPPAMATLWLLAGLLPVSAMFSALCIALASFARSNKEGQYYLMPLLLVSMPLMILPMAPGVDLTLGNSLIPLTGLVLLLRSLLEGEYLEALPFVPPVVIVTLVCCVLAVRWAIDQFNKESVLFRESERVDVGMWLRHLIRDRQDTPSVSEAIFCGVLILVIEFFIALSVGQAATLADVLRLIVISQLVVVATPPLLMTVVLTRKPLDTLLIRRPPLLAVPVAVLLAVVLHPLALYLARGLTKLYPMKMDGEASPLAALADAPYWLVIVLLAIMPAICEELAFRGFILSGLRHLGHRWRAILVSAVFFGVTHPIIQQSLLTAAVGVVIGYIAVQTRSLWPCMAFHATHNAMTLVHGDLIQHYPWLADLVDELDPSGMTLYRPAVLTASGLLAALLLAYFVRLKPAHSQEEVLQEAIDRGDPPTARQGADSLDAIASQNGAASHADRSPQTKL